MILRLESWWLRVNLASPQRDLFPAIRKEVGLLELEAETSGKKCHVGRRAGEVRIRESRSSAGGRSKVCGLGAFWKVEPEGNAWAQQNGV